MTERQYTSGPSFVALLREYLRNDFSFSEAEQRLLRRINAGEFVVNKPISLTSPVRHLRLMSRDRLFFETDTETVDVSDIFTLEPMMKVSGQLLQADPVLAAKAESALFGNAPEPPKATPTPPLPEPSKSVTAKEIAVERKRRRSEVATLLAEIPDLKMVEVREKTKGRTDLFTECQQKIPGLTYNEFRAGLRVERARRRTMKRKPKPKSKSKPKRK